MLFQILSRKQQFAVFTQTKLGRGILLSLRSIKEIRSIARVLQLVITSFETT